MPLFAIYGLAGLALLISGFLGGWEVRGWRDDAGQLASQKAQTAALIKASEDARALGIAEGNITFSAGQKAAEQEVRIVTRTVTQIKEVPVYVPAKANAACVVNNGFVQLHNAGASGADDPSAAFPLPATQSVDSASGIELSTVAATVRENYGKCASNANELKGLQDWVRQQQALHR